jgi:hypothetical protein
MTLGEPSTPIPLRDFASALRNFAVSADIFHAKGAKNAQSSAK